MSLGEKGVGTRTRGGGMTGRNTIPTKEGVSFLTESRLLFQEIYSSFFLSFSLSFFISFLLFFSSFLHFFFSSFLLFFFSSFFLFCWGIMEMDLEKITNNKEFLPNSPVF